VAIRMTIGAIAGAAHGPRRIVIPIRLEHTIFKTYIISAYLMAWNAIVCLHNGLHLKSQVYISFVVIGILQKHTQHSRAKIAANHISFDMKIMAKN
jgi:hypothetical protein